MSAAKATTDINNYVPSLTPISSTATMSKSTSLSSTEIQEVTNLSFPRCSCCKTGWYDALGLVDDNDLADAQKLAVSAGKGSGIAIVRPITTYFLCLLANASPD